MSSLRGGIRRIQIDELYADSDVEKIFEKGEEGMKDAEGFIKQMVRVRRVSLTSSKLTGRGRAGNRQVVHSGELRAFVLFAQS